MRPAPGDFDEIELSNPADERRSTGTVGDRLIVGLAALVLLVGIMIAGGNLLKGLDGESASDSTAPVPSGAAAASAVPSATPRPTATPRPPQQATVVQRTPDPAPDYGQGQSMAWLEVLGDVAVLSAPDNSASVLETLTAGAVLLVNVDDGTPGWVQTAEALGTGDVGWIATPAAGPKAAVILHPADVQPTSGDIYRVWPAGDGFVAMGMLPAEANRGWWAQLFVSSDGEHWQLADVGASDSVDVGGWQMADGPSGLLALSSLQYAGGVWLSESSDGSTWSLVGALDRMGSGWPSQMVGSDLGYLVDVGDPGRSSSTTTLWYSADGITWIESRVGLPSTDTAQVQLLAMDGGFFAWLSPYGPDSMTASLAFSRNGRAWSPMELDDPEIKGQLQLVSVGSTLLGVATATDGSLHAWRADVAPGATPHLVRDAGMESAFRNMQGMQIVADGRQAYALGYRATDYQPHLWQTDGAEPRRRAQWPGADRGAPDGGRPQPGLLAPAAERQLGGRARARHPAAARSRTRRMRFAADHGPRFRAPPPELGPALLRGPADLLHRVVGAMRLVRLPTRSRLAGHGRHPRLADAMER
jgi:hypothetical protein